MASAELRLSRDTSRPGRSTPSGWSGRAFGTGGMTPSDQPDRG
jgi:hypothetical protein